VIFAFSIEPLATLSAEQKKKAEKDKNNKVFIVFPLETGKHYCPSGKMFPWWVNKINHG